MMRVRQVTVPRVSSVPVLDQRYMTITLPAAPWEHGQEFERRSREIQRALTEKNLAMEALRASTITCRHPGCGKPISDRNQSGVCKLHNHGKHCGCKSCERRRAKT